jgi:2',3'-cyclic-nucleotide 2'-phosphodiesterase (5'-nucleotidase family)
VKATLRIVSFNDVYQLAHLPRLKNLIAFHRTTNPADRFLVTLPGDFLSPSLLSSLDAGRGMVDCLNDVGVDLVTFGNHEDDVPLSELKQRIGELKATWLATNVRHCLDSLPTSITFDVAGVKIGFLGVVMNDEATYRRPPFGGGALPALESALAETDRLRRDAKCDFVIPLTHETIAEDVKLALATKPAFPVILGGHEHTPYLEKSANGTWIVKAGSEAEHAVVVDIAFEDGLAKVTVFLDDAANYPEDPGLRAKIDRHMMKVHELEDATLHVLEPGEHISSIGTRVKQTTMGTLVCSRLRDALGADACIFNGGGIRASKDHVGRITYGDIEEEIPFDNEVVAARIPGSVLRDAVKVSRANAPKESAAFLQVDDHMKVDEHDVVTHVANAPLDPDKRYCVAIVRNLLEGLDHIEPLVAWAKANPEHVPPAGSGREVKQIALHSFAVALWKKLGGFEAVDADGDGKVTPDEIAAAVARVNAEAPSPITADLILRTLDVNHDHVITKDEAENQKR